MLNYCKSFCIQLIVLSFSAFVTACAPVADQDSIGASGSSTSLNSGCKDQKRKLDQMVAKGQANSEAYRKLLDGYWGKCA